MLTESGFRDNLITQGDIWFQSLLLCAKICPGVGFHNHNGKLIFLWRGKIDLEKSWLLLMDWILITPWDNFCRHLFQDSDDYVPESLWNHSFRKQRKMFVTGCSWGSGHLSLHNLQTLDVFISPKFDVLGSLVRQRNKPLPLVFPLTWNICLNWWFKPPKFNRRECQGYFQISVIKRKQKSELFCILIQTKPCGLPGFQALQEVFGITRA